MKQQQNKQQSSKVTIGLDLGDRKHRFCVLDGAGEIMEEGSVGNDRVALGGLSRRYPGGLMVMEAGCHSPWVSRYLEERGARFFVTPISHPAATRAFASGGSSWSR